MVSELTFARRSLHYTSSVSALPKKPALWEDGWSHQFDETAGHAIADVPTSSKSQDTLMSEWKHGSVLKGRPEEMVDLIHYEFFSFFFVPPLFVRLIFLHGSLAERTTVHSRVPGSSPGGGEFSLFCFVSMSQSVGHERFHAVQVLPLFGSGVRDDRTKHIRLVCCQHECAGFVFHSSAD